MLNEFLFTKIEEEDIDIWMKLFPIINPKDCTFKFKKKFEKIISSFFKAFSES